MDELSDGILYSRYSLQKANPQLKTRIEGLMTEVATKCKPVITLADVEAAIAQEMYTTSAAVYEQNTGMNLEAKDPFGQITVCFIILKNGHKAIGVNEGPINTDSFDVNEGKRIARNNAIEQIYTVLAYEYRNKMVMLENFPTHENESMHRFIGSKRIYAEPMTRGKYNEYRGWAIPENEDPNEEGYLVEYLDGGKANDSRHTGYISWSPKNVFENSYREV